MRITPLNRPQRLVIVVGLSATLYVLGQWLMSIGSNLNFGWVAYAPLSKEFAPEGLHPWVRLVIWLVLIIIWALVSATLLRSDTPRESDQG